MKTTDDTARQLLAQLRSIHTIAAKNAKHGSADWAFVRDTAQAAITGESAPKPAPASGFPDDYDPIGAYDNPG